MLKSLGSRWSRYRDRHPRTSQFLMFYAISNAVTVMELVLMPVFRSIFNRTALVDIPFQVWPFGINPDGSQHYIFDYAPGAVPHGGGGLALFLAVQITILIAEVTNFILQRNVAFRSNSSVWFAAMWYLIAYLIITVVAAAAHGLYKAPIYHFFMVGLGWGHPGEIIADVITMMINAAISFWVFFPIFKVIFKRHPVAQPETPAA